MLRESSYKHCQTLATNLLHVSGGALRGDEAKTDKLLDEHRRRRSRDRARHRSLFSSPRIWNRSSSYILKAKKMKPPLSWSLRCFPFQINTFAMHSSKSSSLDRTYTRCDRNDFDSHSPLPSRCQTRHVAVSFITLGFE